VYPVDEPFAGDERAMLDGMLDFQRAELLVRCSGLGGVDLARRALPPSTMSLLGLVRHLSEVERHWWQRRFAGLPAPVRYEGEAAFELAEAAGAEADYAELLAEQRASREAVAGLGLGAVYDHREFGSMTLRWGYLHMVAEYAGHVAHADLLREAIDGVTHS